MSMLRAVTRAATADIPSVNSLVLIFEHVGPKSKRTVAIATVLFLIDREN